MKIEQGCLRAVAIFLALYGLTAPAAGQESIVVKFTARSHSFDGQTLPFRLFVPEGYDSTQLYPLVLALHGSGERGTDNITQIRSWRLATSWADPVNQAKYPCLVVAPQCPPATFWQPFVGLLNDMIDSLAREFSVDTNRLYVTGLSMGGYGTWDLIADRPERFAAAVPMSAGAFPAIAPLIRNIPIWNFHGAVDEAVPVAESRDIMASLEEVGSPVVYTRCKYADCTGLPDSVLTMVLDHHAQILYTEYQTGGHAIWDESYDNPRLFPWVFSNFRRVPGAVALTAPGPGPLAGSVDVQWTGGNPSDSVEIWYSGDAGRGWVPVERSLPNTGTYSWTTSGFADAATGLLDIFLKNARGYIYGVARSAYLRIDNPGNGAPWAVLDNRQFERRTLFGEDSLQIDFRAADPEDSALAVTIEYSTDDGGLYQPVVVFPATSDTLPKTRMVSLTALANAHAARFRLTVNDGELGASSQTSRFVKESSRFSGPEPVRVTGGGGRTRVNVVDPALLTGDRYRVTFDDTSFAFTVYDVTDVTTGAVLLNDVAVGDATVEGPEFDGMRLVVQDVSGAAVDPDLSGWVVAAPTILDVDVYIPTLPVGADLITGKPYPADYRFSFGATVMDTSSGALEGFPPVPVTFTIRNVTEDRETEFVFLDSDGSGTLTNLDAVFILEPSLGDTALSWGFTFSGPLDRTVPQPGDVYELKTLKPLSSRDVLEFDGILVSVAEEGLPGGFSLWQNYPNPFNPETRIRYSVSQTVAVRLVVYDVLGREVAVLVDGTQQAGTHEVGWNARGYASGMYVCRLTAGSGSTSVKLLLVR